MVWTLKIRLLQGNENKRNIKFINDLQQTILLKFKLKFNKENYCRAFCSLFILKYMKVELIALHSSLPSEYILTVLEELEVEVEVGVYDLLGV